jgi:hypothetical protein
MLVFVLIGVGTAVAVLGASYAGARRATRRIEEPRRTDVRVS